MILNLRPLVKRMGSGLLSSESYLKIILPYKTKCLNVADMCVEQIYFEDREAFEEELLKWCEENCEGDIIYEDILIFSFEFDEDFMAFKLRWL